MKRVVVSAMNSNEQFLVLRVLLLLTFKPYIFRKGALRALISGGRIEGHYISDKKGVRCCKGVLGCWKRGGRG